MKTRAELMLSGGVALLTVAGTAGLWLPIMHRSSQITAEIRKLEADLAKPSDSPERIETLRQQAEQLERRGAGRTAEIPDEAGVADLVKSISARLDAMNLPKREITTGATRQLDEASTLPVTMMLEGPFLSIVDMVREIEGLPRLVRVQRVRIARTDRGKFEDAGNQLRADLVLDAFYGARADADSSTGRGDGGSSQ